MRMRRILLSLAVLATGIVAVRLLVPGDPPGTGEPVAGAAAPGQVSAPAGDRLQASAPTPAARREAPDPGRPELEAASGRTDESSPPRSYPRAPEPARRSAPPPPPDGDPEQLAAWFERQVGGEILRQKHQDSVPPGREVDWAYLEDVFAGRISGICNGDSYLNSFAIGIVDHQIFILESGVTEPIAKGI